MPVAFRSSDVATTFAAPPMLALRFVPTVKVAALLVCTASESPASSVVVEPDVALSELPATRVVAAPDFRSSDVPATSSVAPPLVTLNDEAVRFSIVPSGFSSIELDGPASLIPVSSTVIENCPLGLVNVPENGWPSLPSAPSLPLAPGAPSLPGARPCPVHRGAPARLAALAD